jgi:hypothetical protein
MQTLALTVGYIILLLPLFINTVFRGTISYEVLEKIFNVYMYAFPLIAYAIFYILFIFMKSNRRIIIYSRSIFMAILLWVYFVGMVLSCPYEGLGMGL